MVNGECKFPSEQPQVSEWLEGRLAPSIYDEIMIQFVGNIKLV